MQAEAVQQRTSAVPQRITIARSAETDDCTTGYLAVDGEQICYTLELPDRNNEKLVSRIPRGTYSAHIRYDHPDGWRVELDDVPGHQNIQIHIGNWPFQTEGCILLGSTVDPQSCKVSDSKAAYEKLRTALYGSSDPRDAAAVFDLTVEITGL